MDGQIQRDDELPLFTDDIAAAVFFEMLTGLPVEEDYDENGELTGQFVVVPYEGTPLQAFKKKFRQLQREWESKVKQMRHRVDRKA
jgi:hypothetical protein